MSLRTELDEEIKWRIDEITILKTVPLFYPLSEKQKEVIQKHSIPAIYSLWEGFVSESFSVYITYINSLRLSPNELHKNILTHDIDMRYPQMKDGIKDFEKRIDFVLKLKNYLNREIQLSFVLPTKSNVNLEVINKILYRFNLTLLNENYDSSLDKLLLFRNNIRLVAQLILGI